MTTLSEKMGQLVAVHIHTSKDTSFKKKPVRSAQLKFPKLEPLAPLLSHVKCYSNDFKICLEEGSDNAAAQLEFNRKVSQLNMVMNHIGEDSFMHYVAAECSLFIDGTESNIRNEDGVIRGIHEIKKIFSEAVVKHLRTYDIESKCNIGHGSIYVDDEIVINSGITQSTTLSRGFMSFTEFNINSSAKTYYTEQYHKAPRGCYEAGSWSNVRGDELLVLTFKMAAYSALANFLSRMAVLLDKDLKTDGFLSMTMTNATEQYAMLEKAYSEIARPPAFDTSTLLNDERVQRSDTYQELEVLGLGKAAKQEFAENEAAFVLLEELSKSIGSDWVSVYNPKSVEEENAKHGYYDEFYDGHITLPAQKTRKGMIALKQALEQSSSLATFLIDKNHLMLNVTASCAGYDQEQDVPTRPYQCLKICLGGRPPLVQSSDIISFRFDL